MNPINQRFYHKLTSNPSITTPSLPFLRITKRPSHHRPLPLVGAIGNPLFYAIFFILFLARISGYSLHGSCFLGMLCHFPGVLHQFLNVYHHILSLENLTFILQLSCFNPQHALLESNLCTTIDGEVQERPLTKESKQPWIPRHQCGIGERIFDGQVKVLKLK